jgi:DNA-binding transcriptional ArsR family regulator
MPAEPDISRIAALIGEPARAAMLLALMDGHSLPAGELAYCARISPQTASSHLARMVEGNLLVVMAVGRHRYYALRSAEVAQAIEALSAIAPEGRVRSLREGKKVEAIRKARTCYDHLAGVLGVALALALSERGYFVLESDCCEVTPAGFRWLKDWEIDVAELQKSRRVFARPCVDWSERRLHIGGAVGGAITDKLFDRGWIVRIPDSRGVQLTQTGEIGFEREYGIVLPQPVTNRAGDPSSLSARPLASPK